MIVLDCLTHDRDARAFLHWQLADGPTTADADGLGVTAGGEGGKVRLRSAILGEHASAGRIARGEEDPYLGWVCEGQDVSPASMLQVALSPEAGQGEVVAAEVITAIVPFADDPPEFKLTARTLKHFAREAVIEWADGRVDRIVWTRRLETPVRSAGGIVTNAPLAIIASDPAGGEQLAAVDGAAVGRQGQ